MSNMPDELENTLNDIANDIENVVNQAIEGSAANDAFSSQLEKNLTFYGKTLATWDSLLSINIPTDNIDPDTVRRLFAEVGNMLQTASHYYMRSYASNSISGNGIAIKKADLIAALITYYQANGIKLPPNTVVEKISDSYIKKLTNINLISKLIKDFWKEKVATLRTIKDIISSINITSATELKYLGNADDSA